MKPAFEHQAPWRTQLQTPDLAPESTPEPAPPSAPMPQSFQPQTSLPLLPTWLFAASALPGISFPYSVRRFPRREGLRSLALARIHRFPAGNWAIGAELYPVLPAVTGSQKNRRMPLMTPITGKSHNCACILLPHMLTIKPILI